VPANSTGRRSHRSRRGGLADPSKARSTARIGPRMSARGLAPPTSRLSSPFRRGGTPGIEDIWATTQAGVFTRSLARPTTSPGAADTRHSAKRRCRAADLVSARSLARPTTSPGEAVSALYRLRRAIPHCVRNDDAGFEAVNGSHGAQHHTLLWTPHRTWVFAEFLQITSAKSFPATTRKLGFLSFCARKNHTMISGNQPAGPPLHHSR